MNYTRLNLDLIVSNFILQDHSWDIPNLTNILPFHIASKTKGISLPSNEMEDTPI